MLHVVFSELAVIKVSWIESLFIKPPGVLMVVVILLAESLVLAFSYNNTDCLTKKNRMNFLLGITKIECYIYF
jgi:hypothetical protein